MSIRWEYKVIDSRVSGFFEPALDADALTEHLNELGSQGWDVVGLSAMDRANGRTRDMVILLKRAQG